MLDRAFSLLSGKGGAVPRWFEPYAAVGRTVAQARRAGRPVADTLNAALPSAPIRLSAGLLRFVPQHDLPDGEAYEAFIARTACVPTRDNPHDLFNGLVWLRYASLKRHLNELHAHEIAVHGIGPVRGPVRDALTLFDENAALLQAPEVLMDALKARDWRSLFVTRRPAWANAGVTVFGHALMEKLCLVPHKSITAHVWAVPSGADAQAHLAKTLTPQVLAAKQHLPLPVLGIPGWCADNENPSFYDDTQVFRPLRR